MHEMVLVLVMVMKVCVGVYASMLSALPVGRFSKSKFAGPDLPRP